MPASACSVRCLPSGREAQVPSGATLLEAVGAVHLPLGQSCSGEGLCGRCRVRVVSGAEHLSPVADDEERTLVERDAAGGERLACRARVFGPVSVTTTYW